MSPARICYVSPVGFIGGAELSLLDLLAHLDRDRFHPDVVCFGAGQLADRVMALGMTPTVLPLPRAVERLSLRGERSGPGRLLAAMPTTMLHVVRLASHLRQTGARLVHTNGIKAHVIGGLAGRLARLPVLWHVRDFLGSGRLEGLLLRMGARIPARIVTNSEAVASSWRDGGVPPERLATVHNGVDVDVYRDRDGTAFRAALGVPREAPLVGLIGMLAPWKGQLQFLEAARRVLASVPRVRFVIVGGEPYLTDGHGGFGQILEARVKELGLEAVVHFAGQRADIPEVLAGLDIVVHASTAPEPFGRVLIEAMAARRPLVATDGGAVREILGESGAGLLVPPGEVAPLAEAILALLRDEGRRQGMAENGWMRVRERFTVQEHARRMEHVYLALLRVQA